MRGPILIKYVMHLSIKFIFMIMPDLSEWNALCVHCESVYDKYGSTPIPEFLSDDPCRVFFENSRGGKRDLYIVVEESTLFIQMVRPYS